MTYFDHMLNLRKQEAAHSYSLTYEQRKVLIDWYIDCLEDMDREVEDTAEYLNQLGNPSLIKECVDFMPQCLEDLARLAS